jgi:predicted dehydrogenase
MSSISVSFIGAGYMASEHIKCFRDIPNVLVSGIYSRTRSRAQQLFENIDSGIVCDSIEELYQCTKADLVVISVSELSVNSICKEAFKFPWVCLIEKPAGFNFNDAVSIVEEANRTKTHAYVALNRRQYSSTKTVLEDLKLIEGKRLIHVYDQEDTVNARNLGKDSVVIDNWMYANSIHVVDYLKILGRGDIVSVEPIIRWDPNAPEYVFAKILFSSGDIGIYEAVWNCPGPWAVSITTREKRWELRPLENASFQIYNSRKSEIIDVHNWDYTFKPGLRLQAEEAIKAALGLSNTLPTLSEALESMELIKKIYS